MGNGMVHEHSLPSGDLDSVWTDLDDSATQALFMRLGISHFTSSEPSRARGAGKHDPEGDLGSHRNVRNKADAVGR